MDGADGRARTGESGRPGQAQDHRADGCDQLPAVPGKPAGPAGVQDRRMAAGDRRGADPVVGFRLPACGLADHAAQGLRPAVHFFA